MSNLAIDTQTESGIVLQVAGRFYSGYKHKRLQTAWSIRGAEVFSKFDEEQLKRAEEIISRKGKRSKRMYVTFVLSQTQSF